jgi:hypothetical protein
MPVNPDALVLKFDSSFTSPRIHGDKRVIIPSRDPVMQYLQANLRMAGVGEPSADFNIGGGFLGFGSAVAPSTRRIRVVLSFDSHRDLLATARMNEIDPLATHPNS